ncbi:MAG: WD40/YVTN/BNR-like repeat-containing protein [Limisphaerales bacterium]
MLRSYKLACRLAFGVLLAFSSRSPRLLLAFSAALSDAADKKPAPLPKLPDSWVESLEWRPIGPASMGGRIVDLEVVESNPTTFFVATASGGLFKTANNGTTFQPLFENERTVSIGDVAISASDPNVILVRHGRT